MSNPSYDDRMSPDRNTHAEYSDVDEHSRYSEPSSDTNNGFYNQRPRSRSHSTNRLWPSPMPKCLPVNISASSPCGSVLPKQWQRHCYPKEHHRKPLYPLIQYNYNFNYYYVVNPFEENNHPSLCKNSYVYPYRRHRKRRKCPLIRKLEHCIRCKPHERCMGEASFCDPCQRKGFDVKICKEKEERSDERCKDRCEERSDHRSEERFDDRSDDRSSSHCRLKREKDSSERSMFEREGAIA